MKHSFIIFLVALPKASNIVALAEFCYTLSLKMTVRMPEVHASSGLNKNRTHSFVTECLSKVRLENWSWEMRTSNPGSFLHQGREDTSPKIKPAESNKSQARLSSRANHR